MIKQLLNKYFVIVLTSIFGLMSISIAFMGWQLKLKSSELKNVKMIAASYKETIHAYEKVEKIKQKASQESLKAEAQRDEEKERLLSIVEKEIGDGEVIDPILSGAIDRLYNNRD